MSTIYASRIGRPSYPLLSLFRSLLLGVWCPTAGGHVKNDRRGHPKSTYGYSVDAGVDEDVLYADSAYSSEETREKPRSL